MQVNQISSTNVKFFSNEKQEIIPDLNQTIMNKNIIQIGSGFALGYITKTMINRYPPSQESETASMSHVIKKGKDVYKAISDHPERIPDALSKAEKTLTNNNLDVK